ncbi:MAG: SGNH/GDSL hydrolase family protein [Patescibacteria group bacterium]
MINFNDIKEILIAKNKFWIAFTGDSITSCEWVHPNWREIVEYVLKEELTKALNGDWKKSEWGVRCFNYGYDGSTTKDILDKMDDILAVKPDLIIGVMGGNDPAFNLTVDKHVENIKNIVKNANDGGVKVIWCTSTRAGKNSKKNPEYEPYAKACMSIPENDSFQLIDLFAICQQFPLERIFTFVSEENLVENIKAGETDLQHPNQLGNAYIAKVILEKVFSINFDPEKYIRETLSGEKYPGY